ncbi:MAG: hypothetical protein IT395_02780 [Candidatus Omnitrophica bacterium]|nr:hypothetical protein [Candidatus Omnitrophota bacterium]
MKHFCVNQTSFLRKAISLFVMSAFLFQLIFYPASAVRAELLPNLPAPGTMVSLTDRFEPLMLLGMALNAQNPLLFEFLVDRGQDQPGQAEFSNTSDKLVKYFLSAMTVPDAEAWVNLSPYENDRIMPDQLSTTEMGKTMLEQDYILKQLSASLTNPDKELGKKFWDAVKKKALERFGTTELPMSTLNKVWIVPQKALVLEKDRFVLIGESRLQVMLEEDYNTLATDQKQPSGTEDKIATLSSEVFRDMILPELEKEVNEGSTFSPVRQIYHAVILATWYKKNLRESLLGKVYIDKNKIAGVDIEEKGLREKVYNQYLSAFQKGVYNLIKDEVDIASKEALPRKYFSGGTSFSEVASSTVAEDMARPSTNGRRALNRVRETMDKGRVSSVDVQLADSPGLGDLLRNKAIASTPLKYYFGEKSNVGRGIHVLEDAYQLSTFLGPRNEKGPGTILLVGAGWGVTALQMALRYPNFTIWVVNKEKGLWNIAKAITRLNQFEKDRYSDRQIVEAVQRIKVVEGLDIEDDGARQQMMRTAPNTFDAVIVETNVSLYLTDQIRVFEKLFNERLKADGFFAFEVAFPSAFQVGESTVSEELALASIERAFAGVGDIKLQGKNVTASYTVERKQPQRIIIPLEKDWLRSEMVGGQATDEPRVFQSRYTVRSSSAVTEQDIQRAVVFYALLIFGPNSPKVLTSQIVMDSIPDEERRGMTTEMVGGHLRSLLGEPDAQGQWDRSGAVWREQFGVEVMKAILALDYDTIKNIFLVMPERTAEQESALLSLRQDILSQKQGVQIPDSQILLALKESQLMGLLANPQALVFVRTVINAHLTIMFSPKISNDMLPVEITINRSKRIVNVSKGIAGEGAPSQQLTDEIVRLMANLKDIRNINEVENVLDDPNAQVVIYGRSTRTVIVPRYVRLQLVNNKLEDREMEIMLSSSGVIDAEAPITSDAGIDLKKGGIDFNPAVFDLQIKRDGKGVPLPLPQQSLENIHIEGFYPVIINIQPATLQNFPVFLSALEAQSPV